MTNQNDQNGQDVTKQAKEIAGRVSRQLDAATAGLLPKRLMGTFIDAVMIAVVAVMLNLIAHHLLPWQLRWPVMAFVQVLFGSAILLRDAPYHFGPLEGQSIGKKSMFIRVMKPNGDPITTQQSVRRNLLLAIPFFLMAGGIVVAQLPFLGGLVSFLITIPILAISVLIVAFEIFNMVRDPEHRRWGDIAAGTVVRFE